jgi:hypothetical protein
MTASDHPAPPQALVEALRRANVPLEAYADACAACDEPCDDDHDDLAYPSGWVSCVPVLALHIVKTNEAVFHSFEVDLESQMLGELKPYGRYAHHSVPRLAIWAAVTDAAPLWWRLNDRQIIVSTGKSDWIREVTDDETSIPGLVKAEYDKLQEASDGRSGMLAKLGSKVFGGAGSGVDAKSEAPEDLPGVYPSSAATPPKRSGSSRL